MSALRSSRLHAAAASRPTLGTFTLLVAVVSLAALDLIPNDLMAVGAPAIITALLLDTLLYNEFLISTGEPVMWGFIAAFLYVEAAIVVAVARRVLRRLRT